MKEINELLAVAEKPYDPSLNYTNIYLEIIGKQQEEKQEANS